MAYGQRNVPSTYVECIKTGNLDGCFLLQDLGNLQNEGKRGLCLGFRHLVGNNRVPNPGFLILPL